MLLIFYAYEVIDDNHKDKRITTYSQAERVTKDRKRPPAVGWPLPESKKEVAETVCPSAVSTL